jgi:DNA-binding NtrC family response regulator
VVDDDKSICKLMGSILQMESYPYRVLTSGGDARRAMEQEHFDILFSDIYLGTIPACISSNTSSRFNADA